MGESQEEKDLNAKIAEYGEETSKDDNEIFGKINKQLDDSENKQNPNTIDKLNEEKENKKALLRNLKTDLAAAKKTREEAEKAS